MQSCVTQNGIRSRHSAYAVGAMILILLDSLDYGGCINDLAATTVFDVSSTACAFSVFSVLRAGLSVL